MGLFRSVEAPKASLFAIDKDASKEATMVALHPKNPETVVPVRPTNVLHVEFVIALA